MQSISSYINPNTRGLTSNYKNTAIKDKETYNEAMSQHLLNPVEDLVQVLKTPIKLAKSSSLSRQNNSVNIAEGQRIRVNGGHVITATAHGVEVSGGDNPYDTQSYVKAQRMADALASMLRNAGGTMTTVAHSKEEYARYTEGITDVMSYLGIDTSKDFTVNGMKYSKNKDGWYESEANSDGCGCFCTGGSQCRSDVLYSFDALYDCFPGCIRICGRNGSYTGDFSCSGYSEADY